MVNVAEVEARVATVRDRIAAAAARVGRAPDDVALIAVTKRFPIDVLHAAVTAGLTELGENYASELADKAAAFGDGQVMWHAIGPLQRRVVPKLPRGNLVVHTLDRIALLERFQRTRPEAIPPMLIQVNIGKEPQKAGVLPKDLMRFTDDVLEIAPELDLRGLMAIPPVGEKPDDSRPWFGRMRELGESFGRHVGRKRPWLSMGMSEDYEIAVEEGATHVRVGSALFGPRPT